jgi:DNA-directed RNA polymerase specialized sigma24 family protein
VTEYPSGSVGDGEVSPALAAYRELVDSHAERVQGLIMTLLGDRAATDAVVTEAFRYVWEELDRGLIMGDLEETLYRAALQRAIRRATRSHELRGNLPPTTADDRQVTAYGILQQLIPEHRAAVLTVLWGGLGYRETSAATGVARDRVRDVIFGARQEYRVAYGAAADAPACREIAPSLSLRADGELGGDERERVEAHLAACAMCPATAAAFDEFTGMIRGLRAPAPGAELGEQLLALPGRSARPTGARRILNLALGPAVLVVVLGLGLFIFQQCEEPSIKTGAGRTSDVIYARRGTEGIVILDAGSGRELGRLPLAGVIGSSGREAYGTAPGCGAGREGTMIRAVDAGTLEVRDLGCVERPVTVLAADDRSGRILLGDALGGSEQLLVFDLRQGRVTDTVEAPETLTGVFADRVEIAPDGTALFSTTAVAEPGRARFAVAETDLGTLQIMGIAELTNPCGPDANLLPTASDEVYAYQPACGRVHELHPRSGRPPRRIDLGEEGRAAPASQALLAAPPTGDLLYVLVPGNGVVIVDRARFVELRRLTLEREPVQIAASTDGGMLYVINQDGSYSVVDAGSGRTLLRRQNLGNVAILQVHAGE